MAIFGFGNKKEGGILDVIRCDEEDYLIWKWSPSGLESRKENAIRYGSSLRVKDGEVAVFVYKQSNGTMQDYIEGPFDQTIKTANFPVLTSIVGSAFGGESPFQAEIYFINLAENVNLGFTSRITGISDVRFNSFKVPVMVKGKIIFNITDYKQYIKINRMRNYDLDQLKEDTKENLKSYLIGAIKKVTKEQNISMTDLDSSVEDVGDQVKPKIKEEFSSVFGLNVKSFVVSDIIPDETSADYIKLTESLQAAELTARDTDSFVLNKNKLDMQDIGAKNTEEALRIQREETQRNQRLQTETAFIGAHQLNQQAEVAKTAAESLGQLGGSGGMDMGGGGGFNPAAMMTGMAMGGAVGSSMTNMMGNMTQGLNTPQPPAPPQGAIAAYHIVVNGQQSGPYSVDQLRQLMSNGAFTKDTYVWKEGMAGWSFAKDVMELSSLFAAVPPPIPGSMPPPPPPVSNL